MKELLRKLREVRSRLWAAIKARHEAKPGSNRRDHLADLVRHRRRHRDHLVHEIDVKRRENERKPNFNGHPPNVTAAIRQVIVAANQAGLYVTSTTDGAHATGSYHYSGRAVDLAASSVSTMIAFQKRLAATPRIYAEVFGPENAACVKNGVRISLAEGDALENQHDNHVHVAI